MKFKGTKYRKGHAPCPRCGASQKYCQCGGSDERREDDAVSVCDPVGAVLVACVALSLVVLVLVFLSAKGLDTEAEMQDKITQHYIGR